MSLKRSTGRIEKLSGEERTEGGWGGGGGCNIEQRRLETAQGRENRTAGESMGVQ